MRPRRREGMALLKRSNQPRLATPSPKKNVNTVKTTRLMMSFSDFDAVRGETKASGEPHLHFNYAFRSLVFWSGASAVTMALPVAAYAYALEQGVEYLGDNSWEWAYSFHWSGLDYTATLTATRINNEEFSLEMLITLSSMPEQGVKWFDGIVRYDHTQANWTIYRAGSIDVLDAGN